MSTHGALRSISLQDSSFWSFLDSSTLLSTRKNYKYDIVARSPASNNALNTHIHGSMERGKSQFFNICFVTTIYNTVYTYYIIRCFRRNLSNQHTRELFNVYASYILFKLNESARHRTDRFSKCGVILNSRTVYDLKYFIHISWQSLELEESETAVFICLSAAIWFH